MRVVWTCVRWHLNSVLTGTGEPDLPDNAAERRSRAQEQSAGAERSAALSHNYSTDNPA